MTKRSLIRRWTGDERGVSAIEFAMLAPVLIAFYMGMTEFCQGFMAQKRMGHVSAAVADLITDGESVIVAEATYDYDSAADYLMPGLTRFSHTYYLRPRTSDQTTCDDC